MLEFDTFYSKYIYKKRIITNTRAWQTYNYTLQASGQPLNLVIFDTNIHQICLKKLKIMEMLVTVFLTPLKCDRSVV